MLLLLLNAVLLHPVHETVSEIEWNSKTKRLEVAIRLDALDEQWLTMKHGGDQKIEIWATRYLRRHFRVTDHPKTTSKQRPTSQYHWVGRDDKKSFVWWYFEIEPADGVRPRWIDQRILFDHNENHLNRILILGHLPRRSFTLTIRRPKASLDQADEKQASPPNTHR